MYVCAHIIYMSLSLIHQSPVIYLCISLIYASLYYLSIFIDVYYQSFNLSSLCSLSSLIYLPLSLIYLYVSISYLSFIYIPLSFIYYLSIYLSLSCIIYLLSIYPAIIALSLSHLLMKQLLFHPDQPTVEDASELGRKQGGPSFGEGFFRRWCNMRSGA